jgi:hypothetical protein
MNALRQMFFFQFAPDGIVARVGHVGEPIMHSKGKKDSGVCPGGDGRIASLNFA